MLPAQHPSQQVPYVPRQQDLVYVLVTPTGAGATIPILPPVIHHQHQHPMPPMMMMPLPHQHYPQYPVTMMLPQPPHVMYHHHQQPAFVGLSTYPTTASGASSTSGATPRSQSIGSAPTASSGADFGSLSGSGNSRTDSTGGVDCIGTMDSALLAASRLKGACRTCGGIGHETRCCPKGFPTLNVDEEKAIASALDQHRMAMEKEVGQPVPPQPDCYICHSTSHFAKNCPNKKKSTRAKLARKQ
jgi:hypothetical protein